MSVAIIVPSIRPESLAVFVEKWKTLVDKHSAELVIVMDGDRPEVKSIGTISRRYSQKEIMGSHQDLIYNKNDGVRNLGFAFVHKYLPKVEYIYTLDDDVYPDNNDPIQEHLDALNMKVPVSWISTASRYMRGFPYGIRDEAEVVLSHGVWNGVADYDAATQLVNGNQPVDFYRGPIPRGTYYPMCFTPDSLVTIGGGCLLPIEDVAIGDSVLTDDGTYQKVTNKMSKQINEEIIIIRVRGISKPIKTTKDHEILTNKGWKKAHEIVAGDLLSVPSSASGKEILSDKEMYLLGVYLAEGSISKQDGMRNKLRASGVTFSFHSKEEKTLASRVEKIMIDKFNKKGKFYLSGNQLRVEYYGKDIALWFVKYAGQYSHSKYINKKLIDNPNIYMLLRGLFEGDGHVGANRERPNTVLTTISPRLSQQVKTIINGLGIYSSLTTYLAKNRKLPQFRINMYGDSALNFNKRVLNNNRTYNSILSESAKSYQINDKQLFVRVIEVKKEKYLGEVIDLEVENRHTYTVSGCTVHNCIMNVMFKRKILPWMYQAPMGYRVGIDRFADIWSGIVSKRAIDENGWAVVSGYATAYHSRASSVFTNLKKEASGIEINETFWSGDESHPYFKEYRSRLKEWQAFLKK